MAAIQAQQEQIRSLTNDNLDLRAELAELRIALQRLLAGEDAQHSASVTQVKQ